MRLLGREGSRRRAAANTHDERPVPLLRDAIVGRAQQRRRHFKTQPLGLIADLVEFGRSQELPNILHYDDTGVGAFDDFHVPSPQLLPWLTFPVPIAYTRSLARWSYDHQ